MTIFSAFLKALNPSSPNRLAQTTQLQAAPGINFGTANVEAQLGYYNQVGWLFAVVNRIAEGMAAVQWNLYRGQAKARVIVERHELIDLWAGLNDFQTKFEFMEASAQHFELVGEIWWVLLQDDGGRIREIWSIRPDRMTIIPDKDKFILGYIYRIGGQQVPLAVKDVIFIKRPNPLDPYRGAGAVQTILADLQGERAAALFNRNFFYNSAEPGGVIELGGEEMNDLDWERYRRRWREQHQGVANAHRVAVLERGKWVERRYTQRDMQFKDLRIANRETIMGALGMPQHIMGVSKDVNRANAQAADVVFGRWLLRPRLERIREALNERLVPLFDKTGALSFDFEDPTPADRELDLKVATDGYRYGVLLQNEARRLLGFDDIKGGAQFMPLPPAPAPKQLLSAKIVEVKTLDDPEGLFSPKLEAARRRMMRNWEERLAEEREIIMGTLEQTEKAITKLEITDLGAYSWDWFEKYGEAVIAELSEAFIIAFAERLPEVGPTLAQRLAVEWAEMRAGELLRLTGDESLVAFTRLRVQELVAETIQEGQGLGALQKRLREDLAFSRTRAETIARTETANALGTGSHEAAKVDGAEEKKWFTQGADPRVCSTCAENEGRGWIGIGQEFPSGKQHVPQHPRCMCAISYRHKPLVELGMRYDCPDCGRRLPISRVEGSAMVYCRECKGDKQIRA